MMPSPNASPNPTKSSYIILFFNKANLKILFIKKIDSDKGTVPGATQKVMINLFLQAELSSVLGGIQLLKRSRASVPVAMR